MLSFISKIRNNITRRDRPSKPQSLIAPQTFFDRELARKGHLVHKLKAKDSTGKWAYYFVLVEEHRECAFMRAIDGVGMIDLEDFGLVIASNYGEEPSEETRQFLLTTYQFEV